MLNSNDKISSIVKDIFDFALKHTTLFLGFATFLSTASIYSVKIISFLFQIGLYHYGFNVPIQQIDSISTGSFPYSFIFGAVVLLICVTYAFFVRNACRNGKTKSFFLKVFLSVALFCAFLLGAPVINYMLIRNVPFSFDIVLSFFQEITRVLFTFSVLQFALTRCILVFIPYKDKLSGISCRREKTANKLESINGNNIFTKVQKQHLQSKLNRLKQKEAKINKKCTEEGETKEHSSKTTPKELEAILFAIVVTYVIFLALSPFLGLVSAHFKNEFELVYTNDSHYVEQLPEVQYAAENSGLVILYQNNSRVVAAACNYSKSHIKIDISMQYIIPVESIIAVEPITFRNHIILY